MPGLILPRRWTFQPPSGARINWAHPLTQGLMRVYAFNEGGGVPTDRVFGKVPTPHNTPTWTSSRIGSGMSFASASSQNLQESSFDLTVAGSFAGDGFSVLTWTIPSTGNTMCPWDMDNFGGGYSAMLRVDSGTWDFWMHSGGSDHAVGWTSGVSVGSLQQIVSVWDRHAGSLAIYGNGILQNSAAVGLPDRAADALFIGSGGDIGGATQYYNGQVFLTAFWGRALGPTEVERLYSDPWGMFETPRYWKWMGYTSTATPTGGGRNFAVIIG